MASPPPVLQPIASRSPSKPNIDMAHPMPDLQSLQGAYVGNIERLEEHAERMSEAGSDLNQEIRKLHSELKRSESRRSSTNTRSRNVSTSSHANSIVDVNGPARWGGYSPGGYVTSPVGSLRSGSFSGPSDRQRSGSKASRLGQVVHPEEVVDNNNLLTAYPGSPNSLHSAPLPTHDSTSPPLHNPRKVSSFTRKYDEIANELREELRNSIILDPPTNHHEDNHQEQYQYEHPNHHEYPDRPPTAASTDTTRQARTLWQDFDGTHCPDTVIEEEDTPPHNDHGHDRHSSYNAMMRSQTELPLQGAPPPEDDMVFYPAPVPRLLNLPKRLSQLPATSEQARRRSQLLDYMQSENRKSVSMLDETPKPKKDNRKSLARLPPQLRASAYFDQPGPSQEFAVKGESAEDTLDSILNASARAPVSAFTDHPFAGHVGDEVYGAERHKRKTSKLADLPTKFGEAKRRSSFNLLDTKRNSSGDALNKLRKRNSSADMNLLVVKASESRMSLGPELDEHDEHARGPQQEHDEHSVRRSYDDQEGRNPDDVYDEEHADGEEEPEQEEPQYYGQPTTLLAELQLRKAQQKTRNMNYATLVEQGSMPTHRTLLQMDSLAEREKQKRMKKKVNLAWEAHVEEEEDSDDDVPLGVLLQHQNQQKQDWDRPVGLIAQRELEEHEPLSRRRARLRGDGPNRPRPPLGMSPSQAHLAVPATSTPGAESEEDAEGETLGERMRRLREKREREAALGDDVRKSTVSADFASEMLSKLGMSEDDKDAVAPKPTPSPGVDGEEETLGQRRARLQAEAAARGDSSLARPSLRHSLSLADVLSANPLDMHNQGRKISDSQLNSHLPHGSLLHKNVVAEERKKAQRLTQNMRSTSHGAAHDPLLGRNMNVERSDDDTPLALKIQAYKSRMSGMPTAMGNPMGNPMGMQQNMPAMNLSSQRDSFMPPLGMQQNMGMMSQPNLMMQNPQMMGMMPQMQFQYPGQQGMMPGGMPMGMQMPGMQMPMGGGMPMMGMQGMNGGMGMQGMQSMQGMMGRNSMNPPMGMGMMIQPMDPKSRENIDRWMQGIQH